MLGETISHYRILEKLGQGGMGEVYLAEDTRLGRKVALKFLAPELARDRESLVRFRNEARAAAELSHPNIATIHDFDEVDGKSFLVLEYLQGQTLRDRIAQGPLPIEDTIRISKAIAAGLAKAHSHGIVHRDIKSANVMLTTEGEVKILDFGLARRDDATQITRAGATLGTIAYMSPEQARGDRADQRSDIWSTGIVLYECLTGRLPFLGEAVSVLTQIKGVEAQPPTSLRTGIPLELEQIVLRCLEKDPALRHQHADDLLANLKAAERHTSKSDLSSHVSRLEDRHTSGGRSGLRGIVRHGVLVALIALVALTFWKIWPEPSLDSAPGERDLSIALIDFSDLTDSPEKRSGEIFTNLVQTALVQASPCRVISLEHLKDLQRRRFGEAEETIDVSQALELAREADASVLVTGSVLVGPSGPIANWRLIDCRDGSDMRGERVTEASLFSLADRTIDTLIPHLREQCGTEAAAGTSTVSQLTTSSPEAFEAYLEGKRLYSRERRREATLAFESAVAIDSTFALAYEALSRSYYWHDPDDKQKAQAASDRAWNLRARLSTKDLMLLEASRARVREQFGEALDTYGQILNRWPDTREALVETTKIVYFRQDFAQALEWADKTLSFYPEGTPVTYWKLYALWHCDLAEALEYALGVRQSNPSDRTALKDLGNTYRFRGEFDRAEQVLSQRTKLGQSTTSDRADLQFCRGNIVEAIHLKETSLHDMSGSEYLRNAMNWSPWTGLVQMHVEAGQISEALDIVQRLPRGTESSPSVEFMRFQVLFQADHPDASLAASECSAADFPKPFHRALAFVSMDSLESALDVAEELIDAEFSGLRGTMHNRANLIRGLVALERGDADEAIAALNRPSSCEVGLWTYDNVLRHDALSRAYHLAGRLDEAEETLKSFLKVWGGHAVGHFELGRIYEDMGRQQAATDSYERFLELWADADDDLSMLKTAQERLVSLTGR